MKLFCIKSQSLFNCNDFYFLSGREYELIKYDDNHSVIRDEDNYDWIADIVQHNFITLKEYRKQKLEKLKNVT